MKDDLQIIYPTGRGYLDLVAYKKLLDRQIVRLFLLNPPPPTAVTRTERLER